MQLLIAELVIQRRIYCMQLSLCANTFRKTGKLKSKANITTKICFALYYTIYCKLVPSGHQQWMTSRSSILSAWRNNGGPRCPGQLDITLGSRISGGDTFRALQHISCPLKVRFCNIQLHLAILRSLSDSVVSLILIGTQEDNALQPQIQGGGCRCYAMLEPDDKSIGYVNHLYPSLGELL